MIATFFSSAFSRSPLPCDLTIAQLVDVCRASAAIEREPALKLSSMMLTPAVYRDGGSRCTADALGAEFIALDFDAGDWSVFAAQAHCRAIRAPFILYTTTKSRPDHHHFRLVLFFDRFVAADEYRSVWQAVARSVPATVDPATSDITRLSVMPAAWRGSFRHFASADHGEPIMVDQLLHDYSPPLPPVRTGSIIPSAAREIGNAYAAVALANEVDEVRHARPGRRNSTLIKAAFSLGQLVGAGALDRSLVEDELARATGLGCHEAHSTIKNGLNAGIVRPRALT